MLRICLSVCIAFVYLHGADYPLKDIAKALSDSTKTDISKQSKNLLESTSGIKNYQKQSVSTLKTKLKTKNNIVIRILGDSHIAGDFLSHRLRKLLFKDYTFGFVYPLYPAYHQHIALKYESNNFQIINSRIDDFNTYPLGGIIAKPLELPAHIKIAPQNDTKEAMSKIIFQSPNKNGVIVIEDNASQKFIINAKNPFTWQIISLKLHFPITIHALNDKVLLGGFYINEKDSNIIENLGINGAHSNIWLKWDKELFMQQMRILPADLYVLCYGSNDALYDNFNESTFLKNYGELIDNIRLANPQANILLLSPPPVVKKVSKKGRKSVYKVTKNAKPVKLAISKLAEQKATMLFSMEDFINESGGKEKWEKANLAKKDVHLLPNGYKLIADKLYYELYKLQ